jgi:hypothetical protein
VPDTPPRSRARHVAHPCVTNPASTAIGAATLICVPARMIRFENGSRRPRRATWFIQQARTQRSTVAACPATSPLCERRDLLALRQGRRHLSRSRHPAEQGWTTARAMELAGSAHALQQQPRQPTTKGATTNVEKLVTSHATHSNQSQANAKKKITVATVATA